MKYDIFVSYRGIDSEGRTSGRVIARTKEFVPMIDWIRHYTYYPNNSVILYMPTEARPLPSTTYRKPASVYNPKTSNYT